MKTYAACLSSKDQTWQTPASLLSLLLQAVGRSEFDLDPCSPRADGPVPACTHWTEADDGLSREWYGLVFVNPPYGRALPAWLAKCASQGKGNTTVVGLVPSRTDTRWWHDNVVGLGDVLMLKGRLKFGDTKMSAPFPSAVIVWNGEILAAKIAAHIPTAWFISRHHA